MTDHTIEAIEEVRQLSARHAELEARAEKLNEEARAAYEEAEDARDELHKASRRLVMLASGKPA